MVQPIFASPPIFMSLLLATLEASLVAPASFTHLACFFV